MRNENKLLLDIADSCRLIAQFLNGMERAAFEQNIKQDKGPQVELLPAALRSLF